MQGRVRQSMQTGARHCRAFSLLELLVVIGIAALLISLLLPALHGVNRTAADIQCAQRLRGVNLALINYATDNDGSFPPNTLKLWSDRSFMQGYLPLENNSSVAQVGGPHLACPLDSGSTRSYAMNVWASSRATTSLTTANPPIGRLFKLSVSDGARMILVAEAYSGYGSIHTNIWRASAIIGGRGPTSGQRFGGGGGVGPPASVGRYTGLGSELPYLRHRRRNDGGTHTQALGRVHLGYVDGHVSLVRSSELVDFETGRLTGHSFWSPLDREELQAATVASVGP